MTSKAFALLVASASAATFSAVLFMPAWPKAQAAPAPVEEVAALATTESDAAGEGSRYYSGCNEVRAEGKAPLYRGQPGYREEMDGDGDGIACEAHSGSGHGGGRLFGGGRRRRR